MCRNDDRSPKYKLKTTFSCCVSYPKEHKTLRPLGNNFLLIPLEPSMMLGRDYVQEPMKMGKNL